MASRSIKNRPSIKKKHPSIGLLVIVTVLVATMVAGGVGVYALGSSWIGDLEDYDVSQAEELNVPHPSEMYASDGTTRLAKLQLENRDPVSSLEDISPYVVQGTVATEDERYYEHGGFDLWGIMRATVVTLTGSGREGASTITQQFVRNTILSDEMTDISLKRKVREMYLSVKMEEVFSKDEILLMYLNTINYGNATYGIQAAAQRYFSKDATELTLGEAAALVGIPQSPSNNEPLNHLDNCLTRRSTVLDRMLSNNVITQAEHDAAQAEALEINPTAPTNDGIYAYDYFTSYAIEKLQETYSKSELFAGGLKIITTLDVATQEAAEAAVKAKREGFDGAIQGALVATDPDTGHVKALVGGDGSYEGNLATGAGGNAENPGRPCGSTFKTFTLITALEAGIDPQTMIDCGSPTAIPNTPYTTANPLENINNINYNTRSIQRAFAVSSNTGFVRLQMSVGGDKVIETAKRMGITSPLDNVAALTLGQQNVTMLDMSNAYAVIANGGTKHEAQPILQIYDSAGNLIADNSAPEGERVISPEVAKAATDVMKTVVNTSEGTGTKAALDNGQEVAAKTGTSSSYQDITFCGITPQLSVAIWFGDPSNEVTIPTSTGADDVFANFMNQVLAGQGTEQFPAANNPRYLPSYSDSTYHVGGYYSTSNSETNSSTQNNSNNDEGTEGTAGGTNSGDGTGSAGTGTGSGSGGTGGAGTGGEGSGSVGGGSGSGGSGGGSGSGTGEPGGGGTGGSGGEAGSGSGTTDGGTSGTTGGTTP